MKVYTLTFTTHYPSEFETHVFSTKEDARAKLKSLRNELLYDKGYDEAEIHDNHLDQFYMECGFTGDLAHLEINETKIH